MKTILSIFDDYLKLYHYPHKNDVKNDRQWWKKTDWKFQQKIFSSFGVIEFSRNHI